MSVFVERTDFEAGFAAQWDSHLAPAIAAVRSRHRRQLAFGGFVTLIGTGVIGAGAVMWLSDITLGPRFALLDQPVFAALIAALAALAMIGSWVPLITRKDSYDEPLEAAMRAHLAGVMEPCDNSGFAALLVAELADSTILAAAPANIISHHAGSGSQNRLHMLEVELDIAAVKPSAAGAVKRRLMVMRVSMPAVATSMIMIDSNIPRLSAMQRSSDGRFGRFHVDHDEFDVVFGVLAADMQLARSLLTPEFANSLMALHRSLIDPLADQRGGGMYMTGMFADACLTLVVDLPDKTQDVSGRITASLVEARARRRLARFAALLHLASAVPQRGADAPLPQRDAHRKQALA